MHTSRLATTTAHSKTGTAIIFLALVIGTTAASAATLPLNTSPLKPVTGTATLNDGTSVTYTQNNVGAGATGTISGTATVGGVSTPFSCAYDAAKRQLTGSSICGQILGGALTGGLNITDLERSIVSARISVASDIQATANLNFLNDLTQRRIGLNLATSAQLQMQSGDASVSSSAFGAPQFQSWAFAGGGFLDDNRLGLQKSGHNVVATAGVDHTAGNLLMGGYVAYLNSDIDLQSLDGHLSSDGWALGAYMTYVFDKVFSASISGSYGDSSVNLRRAESTAPITGHHGHEEWSVSATGNAFWKLNDSLGLGFLAGVDQGKWIDEAYTDTAGINFASANESTTYAKVGSVLTLWPGHMIQPYATATYNHLLSKEKYIDERDGLVVGGGVALSSGGRVSGAIEVNTLLLQDQQTDTTVALNIRFRI